MELENFLKERKIDPKIIAVLIDLKESLNEIIEYLKEHNLEMDRCAFEYKDKTYWIYDQQEADESILDFVLFLILFRLLSKQGFGNGTPTLLYLILYSCIRFFIELLRIDSKFYVLGIPFPAFISVFVVCVALPIQFYRICGKVNK